MAVVVSVYTCVIAYQGTSSHLAWVLTRDRITEAKYCEYYPVYTMVYYMCVHRLLNLVLWKEITGTCLLDWYGNRKMQLSYEALFVL